MNRKLLQIRVKGIMEQANVSLALSERGREKMEESSKSRILFIHLSLIFDGIAD